MAILRSLSKCHSGQAPIVLQDDLSIKRLRFGDEILEQHNDIDSDDPYAAFDNDFSIMTLELSRFILRLLEMFGGENKAAYS